MGGISTTKERRHFTIGDGMILVAGTAMGLAWTAQAWRAFSDVPVADDAWGPAWAATMNGFVLALPCVLILTFTWLVLRLRGPRPPWRRVACLPGTTAVLTAAFSLTLFAPFVVMILLAAARRLGSYSELWKESAAGMIELAALSTPVIGFSILSAWVLLVVQRRWRCERSWLDRMGRALGMAWIMIGSVIGAEILKHHLS